MLTKRVHKLGNQAKHHKSKVENGKRINKSDKSTADFMQAYFASVFFKDEDAQLTVLPDQQLGTQISNCTINDKDVDKAISKINPSKSPGPDTNHPMLLSKTAETTKTPLAKIFKISLQENKMIP